MRRIDHKIAYLLILVVFLGTGSVFAAKYITQTKKDTTTIKDQVTDEIIPAISNVASDAVKDQLAQSPPKHVAKQTVSTTASGSGKATTVADNGLSSAESNKYLENCTPSSSPSGVKYTDETTRYPSLGGVLDTYLAQLRWGSEINSFCGIFVTDAGNTGWSGQYVATYWTDGTGKIVSVKGAILLNSSYYSQLSQANFNENMKLILSHEYGHHYTQYHKWVDLNLPVGVRFPDAYYAVRPLSKYATSVDCSSGWSTCESEIIAEDYSYLYSGYGLHQMASQFGYPSASTKTWLDSLTNATSPVSTTAPTPTPTPAPTNQNENSSTINSNTNTSQSDTEKPVVTLLEPTDPYAWDSSVPSLMFKIRSTDNVGVTKIKVYLNDQFQGEWSAANINLSWAYSNAPAGTYTFKAQALDAAGNIGETSITINKT